MSDLAQETEFVEEDDASVDPRQIQDFSQAVLFSTDWTVDTILTQLARANIDLNPRFQRRDAWSIKGKSRFVESIMLGLPIPQMDTSKNPVSPPAAVAAVGHWRHAGS